MARKKDDKTLQHKKRSFLAAYAVCGNLSEAARASRVTRQAHYDWLEHDPSYAKAFVGASEEAADALEAEARRRAEAGVRRLKFHQGQLITIPNPDFDPAKPEGSDNPKHVPYIEHEYSDTLLIFLLKGARPAKYRENHQVDLTTGGKPFPVKVLRGVTMEEI
jgi:hypothetical protein